MPIFASSNQFCHTLGLFDSATSGNAKKFARTAFKFNRYNNETFAVSYSNSNSKIRHSLGVKGEGEAVVVLKQMMDPNSFVYSMTTTSERYLDVSWLYRVYTLIF